MERYERYKDSGVEWVGEIPEGWEVLPLTKYLESIADYRGRTPKKIESGMFLVTAKNIKNGRIDYSLSEEYVDAEDAQALLSRGVPKLGDVLFTTEAPLGEVANIDREDIALAQRVIKFRGKKEILDNYFLKYFLMSDPFQQDLITFATGSTALGIKASKLSKLIIVAPPTNDQINIANYLDRKTAEIDELIAQKERLIELYEEEKTAIINQAVTKGIDPDVKLKDSGVDWLGEIPEGWEVKKLNWMTPILTCGLASTPSYSLEGIPFLSAQNVKDNQLILDTYKYIPFELHNKLTKYRKPEQGDLLVTRVGAGIGDACIVDVDFEFSIYVSLTHIRVNKNDLHNKFLMHFFSTDYFRLLNKVETYQGGGVGNLNVENMKNYRIPIPPINEQKSIVEHIETETARIDAKVAKTKRIIELQKEYRTALISEVVTGKIKITEETTP